MKTILTALVLAALAWVAWPYWAAYDLVRAVQEGDEQKLQESVDWQSVRAGLRDDAVALIAGVGGGGGGGKPNAAQSLGGAIAALAGGSLVDKALEAVVNPQTLAMLVRQHTAEETKPQAAIGQPAGNGGGDGGWNVGDWDGDVDFGAVRYAFLTGPTTFRVDVADKPEQEPLGLVFQFDGGWRLSRVELPLDELRRVMSGAAPQLGKRMGQPGN